MDRLLVKDWMTPDPITVEPDTTLPAAYHIMKLNNIRRLPVVDSAGRLVGIVTLGDIREARPKQSTVLSIWELHSVVADLEVREFMSPRPITVAPGPRPSPAAGQAQVCAPCWQHPRSEAARRPG